jgi:hypothetical protein
MADQATLFAPDPKSRFNPEAEGVWSQFIEDDGLHLKLTACRRARAEGSFVGTCRLCGGYLRLLPSDDPGPDDDMSTVAEWYVLHCSDGRAPTTGDMIPGGGCGHEYVAPDGKVLQRSARHSRMPRTFLRSRSGVIDKPRPQPD